MLVAHSSIDSFKPKHSAAEIPCASRMDNALPLTAFGITRNEGCPGDGRRDADKLVCVLVCQCSDERINKLDCFNSI